MVKYRPLLVAAIMLGLCLPVAAQQAGRTKVGVLTCNTSASLGLIVPRLSRFDLRARLPGRARRAALHRADLRRHQPDRRPVLSALRSAGGCAMRALRANALIGGSHRSIALQPLSVEGQVGVNLALGVAGLTLRSVP